MPGVILTVISVIKLHSAMLTRRFTIVVWFFICVCLVVILDWVKVCVSVAWFFLIITCIREVPVDVHDSWEVEESLAFFFLFELSFELLLDSYMLVGVYYLIFVGFIALGIFHWSCLTHIPLSGFKEPLFFLAGSLQKYCMGYGSLWSKRYGGWQLLQT